MTHLAAWLRSMLGGRRMTGPDAKLALEQVLPLDPRRRLCLIRCEGRHLLLLVGGPQDLSLGWLPERVP